ncbi:hypothetical protein XIS1_480096 [Xenorhabdus innexi]|uniref:Uncharacterized protein n=1 Tax=Xenorhabdus innexi TaxID=290109 RepID=A0A1N6MYS2_9GAMM|nr:hypothetical protein XIS1_480096 [Xenorhabdus innexi]
MVIGTDCCLCIQCASIEGFAQVEQGVNKKSGSYLLPVFPAIDLTGIALPCGWYGMYQH